MSTIVIDAKLKEKLLALGGVAELLDENGAVIGQFVPHAAGDQTSADFPDVPDEELDRREQQDRRFSADQVIERLRGLRG